jgi:hypothetical protein
MTDNDEDPLIGETIVEIRKMTDEEMTQEYWTPDNIRGNPTVIELSNGTILFPSRDPEGNGPGALFGRNEDQSFGFY